MSCDPPPFSRLACALMDGRGAAFDALLASGAPPDPTALYIAICKKDTARVKALLDRGADPNAELWGEEYVREGPQYMDNDHVEWYPMGALSVAEQRGNPEIVALLVAARIKSSRLK